MEPESRWGAAVVAATVVVVVVACTCLVRTWADQLVLFTGESTVPTHDERVASRSIVLTAAMALVVLLVAGAVVRRVREVLWGAVVLTMVAVFFVL